MTYMLCRNRVEDFSRWKPAFDTNLDAARAAGLRLRGLWRVLEEPNNVFFQFEVESIERAQAFISSPEAARTGADSGVIDGEYYFVEDAS